MRYRKRNSNYFFFKSKFKLKFCNFSTSHFDITRLSARLSARISFLDTEMKIQIRAPNKLTNKVIALRMNVAAR